MNKLLKPITERADFNPRSSYQAPGVPEWFPPLMLSVSSVKAESLNVFCAQTVLNITQKLEPDDYLTHIRNFYREGILRFGDAWQYADIMTTLCAAVKFGRPRRYLEIGVRRGRSLAIVAAQQKDCEIYGFDMWVENYAGMPNPGVDFVKSEMLKLGHRGKVELVTGNSHETVPEFFKSNPDMYFDLITVDGDHSEEGAAQDISDVLPHLTVGGMIVFDDICHPAHPELKGVWQKLIGDNPEFASYLYEDLGFGVALGIRKRF